MQDSPGGRPTPISGDVQKRGGDLQYVVIEGCIGVGKTTLCNLVAERLEARTVLEQFEENPFLPEFYADPDTHAFKTQMFFLLSRFKQQQELTQTDLFSRAVVSDYMFAKDRIFADLTLGGSEMQLYDQVYDALRQRVQAPDLVIYLQAPLDVIVARIKKRGRDYEMNIDPDYLESLVDSYGRFFGAYDDSPLLVVNTEELNFPERDEDVDHVMAAAREAFAAKTGGGRFVVGAGRQQQLV